MTIKVVVVLSAVDPVAEALALTWGTLPAEEGHVEGAAIRRLADGVLVVRRPGRHVHDEMVDLRLPVKLHAARPTLVFPSIHRSEKNVLSLTAHPLGNPGATADLGGRPRRLSPTDPRRMTAALRLLAEGAGASGMAVTFEATHHGPLVGLPAFFLEIGYGDLPGPPASAVELLSNVIRQTEVDPSDRVALGVGGGHYVPHFTELALRRRWAFGHLLSRHALEGLDRATFVEAYVQTPGAEGVVYARAEDSRHPALAGAAPRLREQDAAARERRGDESPTAGARSASGT